MSDTGRPEPEPAPRGPRPAGSPTDASTAPGTPYTGYGRRASGEVPGRPLAPTAPPAAPRRLPAATPTSTPSPVVPPARTAAPTPAPPVAPSAAAPAEPPVRRPAAPAGPAWAGPTPPSSPQPTPPWQGPASPAPQQPTPAWEGPSTPAPQRPTPGWAGPASAQQPAGPAGAASASTGAPAGEAPDGNGGRSSGRPRWLVPLAAGAGVLVVAAVVIALVVTRGDGADEAPPAVASTILLPSPTPTVAPVARTATTAFASALPTSVLQYALASSADDADWLAANALEAYTETYTDGGSGTVTVQAGQWETPEEATAFAATLVGALPTAAAPAPSPSDGPALPQSGDVTAGGQKVGTFTVVDAGDGTGVAVWTNGTTVFRAVVPVEDAADFYAAYPL